MARPFGTYNTATRAPRLHQVWQSMRILRGRFTSADLLTTADSGESAVHKYCRALCQAGYLRLVQAAESGRTGSRNVYALVRDSGPAAPIRRADGSGVYDPNTRVVWGLDAKPVPNREAGREAGRDAAMQEITHGVGAGDE